jgi:hypothetical protein
MIKLKLVCFIFISVSLLLLLAAQCGSQPTPIAQSTPIPSGVEVTEITEGKTVTTEITQRKLFDQCDSASPFNARVQFSQSVSQEGQQEVVLGVTGSGEAGVSTLAKVKLVGSLEQHFANSISNTKGHEEGVAIEVQPRTKQEYIIVWREIRREGNVEYIESGVSKTATYSYRIGLELVSTKGKDLICPGQEKEENNESSPSPTPLPTYTQYPTPVPDTPIVKTATATPLPTPTEPTNTAPGTILEVGEWWKENGVWVQVNEIQLHDYGAIKVFMTVMNRTENKLLIDWAQDINFSLIDNTGHRYSDSSQTREGKTGIDVNEKKGIYEYSDWSAAEYRDDHFFNSDVTELIFTVTEFSRISRAQWRLPISK